MEARLRKGGFCLVFRNRVAHKSQFYVASYAIFRYAIFETLEYQALLLHVSYIYTFVRIVRFLSD